ncbi:hypothetical protein COOONC_11161 [Cooperia oncophora]
MKNKLNENKPGERPDTIYLAKVPIKWFSEKGSELPSEDILKTAMESFGKVRRVDIPACDPLRKQMNPEISGIKTKGFAFGPELFFEAYVQYVDYAGFSEAMDAFRNMKWTKRIDGKVFHANVKVDFDRTRHLSDANIKRREAERERIDAEKRRYEAERLRKEAERLKREEEERLAKEAAEALRRAVEDRAAESKRFLELMFEHIQRKEDRRVEVQEARLRAERRAAELLDIPTSDKEQHLRLMLLHQREIRMREKLKEKIRQSHDQNDVQQSSSKDLKPCGSSESRMDKAKTPRESEAKQHQTRKRSSSESSGQSHVSMKKHRHRRKHKSKSDHVEESDAESRRRKRKSKDLKPCGSSESRMDKAKTPRESEAKQHQTRKRSSSESSGQSHVSMKKHRHRRKHKSKSDHVEESDAESRRRKRKSKGNHGTSSEAEGKSRSRHHRRRRSSTDSLSDDRDSHRSHRRHRHNEHKKSKKRKRSK